MWYRSVYIGRTAILVIEAYLVMLWWCNKDAHHDKLITAMVMAIVKDVLHGSAFLALLYVSNEASLMSVFKFHGNLKDSHLSWNTFLDILKYGSMAGILISFLIGCYFVSKAKLSKRLHLEDAKKVQQS